jgi:hypothetical protein
MQKIKLFSLLLCLALSSGLVAGGDDSTSSKGKLEFPSIGVGFGMMSYSGNVGNTSTAQDGVFSAIRPGYHFNIEERFHNIFAVSVYGSFGQIAGNDHTPTDNLNFQTKISQYGLDLVFPFDNGFIMKRGAMVVPYISVGLGFLSYHPYADSLDSKGRPYYYWSDGSVRDLPPGSPTAVVVNRDYVYETALSAAKSTVVIPLGLGFRINITDHLSSRINFSYNYTLAKDIDGKRDATADDKYVYLNVSLHYRFGKSQKETDNNKNYEKVDWVSIDNLDSDEDGVKDSEDKCPGTPKGVKVDASGCPLDTDGDGVPDYLDLEPNTRKGVKVDEHGVKLDYKKIAADQKVIARYDSIYLARNKNFNQAPSREKLDEIEQSVRDRAAEKGPKSKSKIPAEFREMDKNKDGIISVSEVTSAIDAFFNGENSLTVDRINRLIDYFFEQ